MKKIKVGFVSLGCPKNQVDTEIMLAKLAAAGYEITAEEIEADVIIVNTCAFIESAKKESIDNILDIAWLKKNARLKGLVVAGCLPERYRDELMQEMPEVDAAIGVGSLDDIVEAVEAAYRAGSSGKRYTSFKPAEGQSFSEERILTTPEYFAYLKIAEGCDNRCTYCAIPSIRGSFRSRPMDDIVKEAVTLEQSGVKELLLVAQDTTRYGEDIYGEYKLDELIREITRATSIPWLRILYAYPDRITDGLVEEMANNPRVLKYIDMPIQHISDPVLKRMNRRGGSEAIRSSIAKLRAAIPGIVIRTTLITGFPGETEADYEQLCNFVKETAFERLGVFPYSREEGTPAYDMPDQLDEDTKSRRADNLMAIQADISESYNRRQLGRTLRVLCEGFDAVSECYFGRSSADAPEIDGKVYFTSPSRKLQPGAFVNVRINELCDYDLVGEAK